MKLPINVAKMFKMKILNKKNLYDYLHAKELKRCLEHYNLKFITLLRKVMNLIKNKGKYSLKYSKHNYFSLKPHWARSRMLPLLHHKQNLILHLFTTRVSHLHRKFQLFKK